MRVSVRMKIAMKKIETECKECDSDVQGRKTFIVTTSLQNISEENHRCFRVSCDF